MVPAASTRPRDPGPVAAGGTATITAATTPPRDPGLDEAWLSGRFARTPWLAPATLFAALVTAAGLSLLFGYVWDQPALPVDTSGFIVTAGLFAGALAIERLTELLIAPWVGGIGGKAGRTVVIGSLAAVLAVIVAGSLGLYLLEILTGAGDVIHTGVDAAGADVDKPFVRSVDILVTAMAIAGGTKPLHDLLTALEKSKNKAEARVAAQSGDVTADPSGSPYRLAIAIPAAADVDAATADVERIVPGATLVIGAGAGDGASSGDAEPAATPAVVAGALPYRPGSPKYVQRVFEMAYRLAAAGYEVEPDLAAPPSLTISRDSTDPRPEADAIDWGIKQMKITPEAILAAGEGEGVTVGHPDTGYRPHDLQPNWDLTRDYDVVDDDDDALDSLVTERDLLEPDVLPARGHGTSTASVIGGQWGDPHQMYSLAPKARIIPYRVMHGPVQLFDSDVAKAVYRAVDLDGCQVISMSLGGFGFSGLRAAIRHAFDRGVIVVAAAGNQVGVNVSPADYPETIAVASSKANGFPFVEGSSQGPEVAITAPGTDVWRVGIREDGSSEVSQSTGTSYATAYVAGLAALWLGKHRDAIAALPPRDVPRTFAHLLRTTATPWTNPEHAAGFGAGKVDAGALLEAPFTGADAPTEEQLEAAMPMREAESATIKITAIGANFFVGEGTNDTRTKLVQWLVRLFGTDSKEDQTTASVTQAKRDENVQRVAQLEAEHHYRTDPAYRRTVDADATPTVPPAASREFGALVGAFDASTDGAARQGAMSVALRRALAGTASVRGRYRWVGMLLLALALASSFALGAWWGVDDPVGITTTTAVLLTAFYVAAQALERIVEYTFGRVVFYDKPDRVTERALILLGVTVALGCLLAGATGFRLLEALGGDAAEPDIGAFSRSVSVFVTGLAIGGGTKPLHDLISRIQAQSKAA